MPEIYMQTDIMTHFIYLFNLCQYYLWTVHSFECLFLLQNKPIGLIIIHIEVHFKFKSLEYFYFICMKKNIPLLFHSPFTGISGSYIWGSMNIFQIEKTNAYNWSHYLEQHNKKWKEISQIDRKPNFHSFHNIIGSYCSFLLL